MKVSIIFGALLGWTLLSEEIQFIQTEKCWSEDTIWCCWANHQMGIIELIIEAKDRLTEASNIFQIVWLKISLQSSKIVTFSIYISLSTKHKNYHNINSDFRFIFVIYKPSKKALLHTWICVCVHSGVRYSETHFLHSDF